ncbi:MAG: dipeptidase [Clostridia bacterium]|nr:dipeptidase [Clostridia bacterium]
MIPILDMHCDTVSQILNARLTGKTAALRQNELDADLGRMRSAGYLCQNFALFTYLGHWVPGSDHRLEAVAERYPTPTDYALALSDTLDAEVAANPDLVRPVTTATEIEENFRSGKLSALKTIEEGAVYRGDPALVREFYDRGVRMTTITWNYENELGFPNRKVPGKGVVPDTENGLTPVGKDFVALCKELGIIVDISHLNDAGIRDVFSVMGKTPFVASHSNARALTGHPRNLTDEMLRRLADCGGVTGINFCSDFINDRNDGLTRIDDIVRHIRYIENVAGIDAIGLGSDFDGIDNRVETDGCDGMQQIAAALSREGFSEEKIEKIFYKNALRVYRDILG